MARPLNFSSFTRLKVSRPGLKRSVLAEDCEKTRRMFYGLGTKLLKREV